MSIAVCGIANAHPGHGGDFMAGISHPLSGADHLLAMIAVGVWAYQLGGRANWMVPASFVSLMAVAGGIGIAGIPFPMIESGIATSVLILGLLITFSVRVTPAIGACVVAMFAVFHGYAHAATWLCMAIWPGIYHFNRRITRPGISIGQRAKSTKPATARNRSSGRRQRRLDDGG